MIQEDVKSLIYDKFYTIYLIQYHIMKVLVNVVTALSDK